MCYTYLALIYSVKGGCLIRPEIQKPARVIHKRRGSRPGSVPVQSYQISAHGVTIVQKQPTLIDILLELLYKNCYLLGMSLLRSHRRFVRHTRRRLRILATTTLQASVRFGRWTSQQFSSIGTRIVAPYNRLRNYYQFQRPSLELAHSQRKFPYHVYLGMAGLALQMLWHIVFGLFNYVAPVAAAIFLINTVGSSLDTPMGLHVSYEIGNEIVDIGYVKNEKQYESAIQDVMDRIISDSSSDFKTYSPVFRLEAVESDEAFLDEAQLANKIVEASGGEIEDAYGLYINNVFYGAVSDQTTLLNELDDIKNRSISGKPNERAEFDKKIRFSQGIYPSGSVVPVENLIARINRVDTHDEVYVVQEGDTPELVADKLNMPYSLLLEMNPYIELEMLAGEEIYTARARPFLSVRSIFTDVYNENFDFEIIEVQNATYARGYRNITQDGIPGVRKVTAEITTLNGIEIARNVLDSIVVMQPVPERAVVGVNNPQALITSPGTDRTPSAVMPGETGFIWPAASGKITCGLGGYPGHTGVDIASDSGTPIYASASGTVVLVRNMASGYGRHILIDHGNNYQTLYAHNSELYVSEGDIVGQGQVIAAMGRTGRATGVHVHFEVRYDGKYQDPVNYIGNIGR